MSDRYRIVRRLGGGGMAEVFLAHARGEEGFEKPVAIKRLLPHLARDPDIARMFLAEARLAMHLNHQNLVQVLDLGRGPEGLYLVMECVNGWDLGQIFGHAKTHGWFPEHLAAYVASQVAAGMAHASTRVVNGKPILAAHRDISPSNILITADGEVKVADFGIAKLEDKSTGTEPGSFKGKVPFSAPEVLHGAPASIASDQFSLGVVLFRMLGRGYPFGYTENLVLYAEALAKAPPAAVDFASPGLRPILSRLLAKDPAQRYPSWSEVGRDLARHLAVSGAPADATELANYLHALALPPPPLELPEEDIGHTVLSQSRAGRSAGPVPTGLEFELDPDWKPSGKQLDASGQLTADEPPVAPARRPPPPRPAAAPAADEPLELAYSPEQLRAEAAAATAPPLDPSYQAEHHQLARRKKRTPVFAIVLAIFVGLIGLAAAAVFVVGARLPRGLLPRDFKGAGRVEQPVSVLRIDSEPSGATVFINDVEVGTTPLAVENTYPRGVNVPVRMTLRGHAPWRGTFKGGTDTAVEAQLRRR